MRNTPFTKNMLLNIVELPTQKEIMTTIPDAPAPPPLIVASVTKPRAPEPPPPLP
jgi:hypothetical protein